VHFDSPSQLLDYFELPKNGYHYMRLVQGFQRVFAATIFFATEDQRQLAAMSTCVRFHFFDHLQICCNREQCSEPDGTGSANVVTLSEPFYNEIAGHKIPVERRVVAALGNAPGMLDLYVWLVWRSWNIKGEQQARVPLSGGAGLIHQLGSKEYSRHRDFRQKLAKWLRELKAWWPECPASLSSDGKFLVIGSGRRSPAIASPTVL